MSDVELKRKMQFTGKVVKMSLAGAVIDIGVDQPAVLHVSQLPPELKNKASRRVDEALELGQTVDVWVRRVKEDHIELTMIKPLDLEWRDLKKGMSVKGTVVKLEKFGAFVEIGAERPGLIHISELTHGYVRTPSEVVKEGDEVESVVLEINRRKKQIKLSMKALEPEPEVTLTKEKVAAFQAPSQPREKIEKRRKPRKNNRKTNSDGDFLLSFSSSSFEDGEAEPTAMEIAIREAMNRAQVRKQEEEKGKKGKGVSQEQEDLLSRTLEQKVRS